MGNCLKTQLKQEVQNSNLLKLGEIEFDLTINSTSQNNGFSASAAASDNCVMRMISAPAGATFIGSDSHDYGTTVELTTSLPNFILPLGNYKIGITNYVSINGLSCTKGRVDSLKIESRNYNKLALFTGKLFGNIENLSVPQIVYLYLLYDISEKSMLSGNFNSIISSDSILRELIIENASISAELSTFANNTTIQKITLDNAGTITGNISSLAGCSGLKDLQLNYTDVQGSTADFLNNGALVHPNLKLLLIQHSPNFTVNQEDVATLQSLGVTCFF